MDKKMQRIFYIAHYNGNPNQGVTKKIISQVEALNKKGVETFLIFLSNSNKIENGFLGKKYIKFYIYPSPPFNRFKDKVYAFFHQGHLLKNLFNSFENDDIIYMRNIIPNLSFLRLLKSCKQSVFIEVPSNNIEEAIIRNSRLYQILLKAFGNLIGNSTSGIIGVTDEIINLNFPKLHQNIPRIAIGNAIDVKSVPLNPIQSFDEDKIIEFTTIAHISVWHGLDRFLLGMADMKNKNRIHFNIVGEGPELNKIIQLSNDLQLKEHITFHGFLSGNDLNKILYKTHVGVSNLGTHRKNITQTSPLKSREFCARGIPFIYSCYDNDFNIPYAYQLEADNEPINIDEVVNYFKNICITNEYNIEMREYAQKNLTWDSKMDLALDFMLMSRHT
jgi:glycosyltransferase involved in cell wall biosynthesis